ncbi:hypothetical protein BC830DRAFT_1109741 [Chytriomyces sp. MP71]|nr:hypothetical protein BC830DRAFT_1109741 [Chytriomyces sp. MP71]
MNLFLVAGLTFMRYLVIARKFQPSQYFVSAFVIAGQPFMMGSSGTYKYYDTNMECDPVWPKRDSVSLLISL